MPARIEIRERVEKLKKAGEIHLNLKEAFQYAAIDRFYRPEVVQILHNHLPEVDLNDTGDISGSLADLNKGLVSLLHELSLHDLSISRKLLRRVSLTVRKGNAIVRPDGELYFQEYSIPPGFEDITARMKLVKGHLSLSALYLDLAGMISAKEEFGSHLKRLSESIHMIDKDHALLSGSIRMLSRMGNEIQEGINLLISEIELPARERFKRKLPQETAEVTESFAQLAMELGDKQIEIMGNINGQLINTICFLYLSAHLPAKSENMEELIKARKRNIERLGEIAIFSFKGSGDYYIEAGGLSPPET